MQEHLLYLLKGVQDGDSLSIARAISIIENDHPLAEELLISLTPKQKIPVIGITGPPGSGKSTLVNALTENLVNAGKRVAIIAVDPSSPFNHGALLGDRIRMARHFNRSAVYIRSMASRGALGGLAEKTIEISDLLQSAKFDVIFVETVGVGQSEIDVAGLADLTVVVLVPESGDEIQHLKSGLMEVADVFVLNKADREGADRVASNLKKILKQNKIPRPVISTIADKAKGIDLLVKTLGETRNTNKMQVELRTEKAWHLIQSRRMKDLDKKVLLREIRELSKDPTFNLYRYIQQNY